MSRQMVVLPLELAREIVSRNQGHALFDLKADADRETVDRLNKSLNRKEGEQMKEKPLETREGETKEPEVVAPETPRSDVIMETPKRRPRRSSRTVVKAKLLQTNAFNSKSGAVYNFQGDEIKGSDIASILDYAYGKGGAAPPAGAKEIASRLHLLEITDFPNDRFKALVTKTPTPPTKRWKKF